MSAVSSINGMTPQLSEISSGVTPRTPTAVLQDATSAPSAGSAPAASPAASTAISPASESDGGRATYSAQTRFDAATGEWAFIIERHPPEVGIPVAEQSGFTSQYSATVNSSADLRRTFSLMI